MNELQIITHNNERVLTTARLAEQYGTTERRVSENFNANKSRYIEGKHFYCLKGKELTKFLQYGNSVVQNQSKIRTLYLWTEKGALLHAKSLNTDKAWQVYEFLVDNYFNPKQKNQSKPDNLPKSEQLTLETSEYHYFDKTYKGQPVLSVKDIEHFTGLSTSLINWYLHKRDFIPEKDYYRLERFALREFKAENPNIRRTQGSPFNVITKSGFVKLMKVCGCQQEMPKCFEKPTVPLLKEKKSDGWPVYTPNEEMNALMAEVRDKAQRIQAYSYLLTNVDLEAKSRLFRGELRCEIQRLNMMIDKIDDVRF